MKGRVLDESVPLSAEKVFRSRYVLNDLDQVCGASRTGQSKIGRCAILDPDPNRESDGNWTVRHGAVI
jgi:hypothetical protein